LRPARFERRGLANLTEGSNCGYPWCDSNAQHFIDGCALSGLHSQPLILVLSQTPLPVGLQGLKLLGVWELQ
jgi:hypothetical protein